MKKDPGVLRERDDAGAGPLHHASAGGHVRALHFITSATDQKGEAAFSSRH